MVVFSQNAFRWLPPTGVDRVAASLAGVTPEQYDAARDGVGWETHPPHGGVFHVASFDDDSLRITDVRESAEAFERFNDERLGPATAAVGIQGEPEVEIRPAHRILDPVSGKAWS